MFEYEFPLGHETFRRMCPNLPEYFELILNTAQTSVWKMETLNVVADILGKERPVDEEDMQIMTDMSSTHSSSNVYRNSIRRRYGYGQGHGNRNQYGYGRGYRYGC